MNGSGRRRRRPLAGSPGGRSVPGGPCTARWIWVGGIAAVAVGGVRGARHRANAAADLAALAGAAQVAAGDGGACGRAESVAVGSGARLVRCQVEGDVVEVSVTVDVIVPMGIGALKGVSRARAGPVGGNGVAWRDTARCTECQ
ncbi:hypothetical protein E1264_26285 [Actinomadura sp. KC216]|uniref:Rv3654c family TadE-like protein n=1 Tax=Actinomadura sp. KC216 TaxID=2530370 RepID=UPI001049E5E5|nr:hypothetical protein E1264_26285 [Actinomadura sp. KC216]